MSERKPPLRPPPPRRQAIRTQSSGSSSSPGKSNFRSPFSGISISYKPTSSRSLDDSDEEIQIVRKTKEQVEETHGSDSEEGAIASSTQCGHSTQSSEPEESGSSINLDQNTEPSVRKRSLSPSKSACELSLYSSSENLAFENQKTWPSKTSDSYPPIPMKFLKAKNQADVKLDPSKSELSLSPEDEELADVGSHSSRSHLHVDSETKPRERSPSPFQRFLKLQNSDSTLAAVSNDKPPQPDSAISLSSLLASERESGLLNSENEDSWEHVEEESEDDEEYYDSVSGLVEKDTAEPQPPQTPDKTPSSTAFLLCVLLLYMYFVSAPNAFISGIVIGSLLVYLMGCVFLWLSCPEDSISERYIRELNEYNERLKVTPLPDYKSVDPGFLLTPRELQVRKMKQLSCLCFETIFFEVRK